MRSNGLSPPSASRRAYSFVRDQPARPPVSGQHRAPPARTNSCPPDADMFKTRMMRSNSDGYTSASTSFMTEGSTSPTSSASTHPSDSEEAADPHHPLHDKKKAPECYPSSFNPTQLELESRRRDLLWRETEKQWKDKHGNTLSRAEDMAFRQKVERGVGQAEDGPQEKEWRDMWKTTDSYWNEFEARWRQDLAQRRSASRNDDGHFHTAHSDSRDMTSPDDDNTMTSLMSSFEREMGEKRRVQRLSEVERAECKRREHEREAWKATLDREQEIRRPSSQGPEQERIPDTLHRSPDVWPQDRLRRPDVARTRSSSVVVDARPSFRRSRSGSLAAAADILPTSAAVDPLPFETAPKFDEKPLRMKRHRPSRGSKESFDFLAPEADPLRAAQAELHHADEAKQQYLAKARHHLQEELRMCDDSQREELIRAEKARRAERREHERRSRGHPIETETDFHRSNEAAQRQRDATSPPPPSAKEPLPQQPLASEQVSPKLDTSSGSIQEHLLKLEAEQAALARRIQELRIAAEAAESAKLAQAEQDRGRERERDPERDLSQKTKMTEPRPKVQEARKRQSNEADVFKAMQERLRKAEEQRVPERTDAIPPKAKRSATIATFDHDSLTTPTDTRPTFVHSETEPPEGRVRFLPSRQSPDELRAPLPARPRTPGPGTRATTPARVRTPSPRSQSPVAQSGSSSIASSNATRDTSPGHEVESSVHEAVAPRSPKPQPAPSAHSVPRPAGRSREAGPSASTSERPKSGTATTVPGLNVPPHVNTSPPPIEVSHDQDASPVNAKTPRASSFDPDRTPRAQACPVPDASEKSEPTLAPPPLAYVSPSHFRARADEEPTTTKRRVDAAVGATVAAAAAETFDRAGSKKRNKDAELRAQEERRASEEQLAREQRRAEDERRREQQRAEEARKRDAEKREREREEQARQDRERRERQEQEERRRRWGEPTYERVSRQPSRSEPTPSIIDAWNSYELRWSALGVASSTQPITFRNIPWPLMRIPTGPESITPQAVGAFLLSPLHSQDKSRKERLRGAMLRWHSDKFEGRWMARIDESERAKVKEAVGAVARSLTELMTKPDLY